MRVLIVADSVSVARDLCAILKDAGHECMVSSEGGKAIDDAYANAPDLLLIDADISHPTVQELLRKFKGAPSTRDIPLLVIAAKRSVKKLAECYELGAYDYILRPFFREEVLSRMGNIGYVSEKLKEVEKLLVRDYLTGLYNRKFFMERFAEEISWAVRYGEPLSLIILDIDHFKKINDTYGHGYGDEVLRQVAGVLGSVLRAYDVLARYGGEEFVVLLSNTAAEDAFTVGEKLRVAVEAADFICDEGAKKVPVTISVGVAATDDAHDLSAETLINRADEALYRAKSEGRNRVVVAQRPGPVAGDQR